MTQHTKTTPAQAERLEAFSPGPWQLDGGQLRDHAGNAIASFPFTLGGPEDQANAQLAKAAPELAEALHFMCAAVRTGYHFLVIEDEGILDAGLAALASAGWDANKGRRWPKGSQGQLLEAASAREELVEAARALLRRMDHSSTWEFYGAERAEREALRTALAHTLGCYPEEVYELPSDAERAALAGDMGASALEKRKQHEAEGGQV